MIDEQSIELERKVKRWLLTIGIFVLFLGLMGIMAHGALAPKYRYGGIPKRQPLRLTPDGVKYLNMAKEQPVKAPYVYRWAGPKLLRYMNLELNIGVKQGWIAITLISMALFYTVLMLSMNALNIELRHQLLGILSSFVYWHVYVLQNMFLMDGPSLLFTALALYALIKRNQLLFTIAIVIGVHFKEPVLFLAPAWFFIGNKKDAFIILLACLTSYAIPRVTYGQMGTYLYQQGTAWIINNFLQPTRFVWYGLTTWGIVWWTGMIGIFKHSNKELKIATILLLIGVFITLWFAGDVGRMLAMLAPVMIIGTATFFQRMYNETPHNLVED